MNLDINKQVMEMLTRGEMGDTDLPVRSSPHPPTPASICKAAVDHAYNE